MNEDNNKTSWKRLGRKTIYDAPFLKVYEDKVQLPNGTIIEDYSLTKKPDIVIIVATDKDNKLIVGSEYKYAADKKLLNTPAGGLNIGESPIEAAKRELLEETGYGNGKFTLISELYNYPTKDLHKFYVVRAENLEVVSRLQLEETESFSISLVSL
ncbi:MAG: NUDIX hydrolase, partial [Patescibacteria group bacterium]